MPTTTDSSRRYDGMTIALHWLTALLVVALFAGALMWTYGPRSIDRHWLESLHVSMGIGLAGVLLLRLVWRLLAGLRLPAEGRGASAWLAKIVHWALYLLLAVQVGLGFTLRWFQGEDFSFFGLFDIPALVSSNRALAHTIEDFHNITAWTLVVLAGGHAVVAIFRALFLRDRVLQRMLPLSGEHQ